MRRGQWELDQKGNEPDGGKQPPVMHLASIPPVPLFPLPSIKAHTAILLESSTTSDFADTFGLFLASAIPRLKSANGMCHDFLSMLALGNCDAWSNIFAETGVFSFHLEQLQRECFTREEVKAVCQEIARSLRAVRLVWHFPDTERLGAVLSSIDSV